MEECDTKDHLAIDTLLSILNIIKPGISLVRKCSLQISLDTSRRLCGKFHTVLKHCDWEEVNWGRRQVESEGVLHFFVVAESHDSSLEHGHEAL
jgi:hypothetical protein